MTFGGQRMRLETQAELDEIKRKIRDRGYYPAVMVPDELDALMRRTARSTAGSPRR